MNNTSETFISSTNQASEEVLNGGNSLNPTITSTWQSIVIICLTRWLALTAWWLIGTLVWFNNPFFQKQLSAPETTIWIWNIIFITFFAGPIWEFANAFFNKTKYLESQSNSVLAWQGCFKLFRNLDQSETNALLFLAVRIFYLPLMIQFLMDHLLSFTIPNNLSSLTEWKSYFTDFGWLQNTLYFIDTIPFVFAYLLNFGNFKTQSVNKNFIAWFFCLSCYPPFNSSWGEAFPYSHIEFAGWWGWISLVFISVYVWASLALGLKAGHLQYRGLCDKGPYAFVRHPAYAFKTLTWLVGGIAWSVMQINGNSDFKELTTLLILNIINAVFWTWVYYMRAITEEEHLIKYPEYVAYCNKVKYRFFPGMV